MNNDIKKFARLCEFINATVHVRTKDDFYSTLMKFLPGLIEAKRFSISLVDETGERLEVFALKGDRGLLPMGAKIPLNASLAGQALRENRLHRWTSEEHLDCVDARLLHESGMTVGMNAPVYVDGKPHGTINVASDSAQKLSDYSATLLFTVASITSAFLRRQKYIENEHYSEEKISSYSRQLEALNTAALRFAKVDSEKALFDVARETIGSILSVHRMSYVRPDTDRGVFSIEHTWGTPIETQDQIFPLAGSIVDDSVRSGRPCYVASLEDEDYPNYRRLSAIGMKSAWCVPVTVGGVIHAAVNAASKEVLQDDTNIVGVLSTLGGMMSVALERMHVQRELRFQVFHDVLTKLPNRAAFSKHLHDRLARRNEDVHALLLIDISRFKDLNDYFGYQTGDAVLTQVGKWLKSFAFGPTDMVARLGGDEFAMLVISHSHEAVMQKLSGLVDNPTTEINDQGRVIQIKTSIGMAFLDKTITSSSQFMRHADLALHNAKTTSLSKVDVFVPEMANAFERRIELLDEFTRAIEHSQVLPYYQPVMDMRTGKVGGLEALARWKHPTRGILTPGAFHEIFDVRELCIALGQTMLRKVTQDMGHWKRNSIPFKHIAINFTDADFSQPGFTLHLMRELSRNNLSVSELMIEITENSILSDKDDSIRKLVHQLRAVGTGVALDDFGTGFASLTHLSAFDFTVLKIDRSFINKLTKSHADFAIVEFLTKLGEEIGFVTTAEGIETEDERHIIERLNCRYGQGYLFAKPVPGEEVPDLIARLNDDKYATWAQTAH